MMSLISSFRKRLEGRYENLSDLVEEAKRLLKERGYFFYKTRVPCIPYHRGPWERSYECIGQLIDRRHVHVEYEVQGGFYVFRDIYFR